MKLAVISNASGKVVAALKLMSEGPIGVGIRSRDPNHRYHEIDVPDEHKLKGIAELAKRIKMDKPGASPRFV